MSLISSRTEIGGRGKTGERERAGGKDARSQLTPNKNGLKVK